MTMFGFGSALATGEISAAVIAANAIGASELAADAVAEIADGIWDEADSGHATAGTFGYERLHVARKTETLAGTNNHGELDVPTITLFTVTGEILVVALIPYCTTNVAGAAGTLSLGVTGSVALFIAATTGTEIDADEFWVDTAPDANAVALPAALKDIVVTDNIIATVAAADLTGGVIDFTLFWLPLSTDAAVS